MKKLQQRLKSKIRKWLGIDYDVTLIKQNFVLQKELLKQWKLVQHDMYEWRDDVNEWKEVVSKKIQKYVDAKLKNLNLRYSHLDDRVDNCVKKYKEFPSVYELHNVFEDMKRIDKEARIANMEAVKENIIGSVNELLQGHMRNHHPEIFKLQKKKRLTK